MMFAGHHTTSGTAAWSLIELLRHPDTMQQVTAELDELYADGADISFHALRQIPVLEAVIKDPAAASAADHPAPVARGDFEVGGFSVHEGNLVAATPAISNRIPEDFPEPDSFHPGRYIDPNQEDTANRWTWIPFGAGRHRCVGAAFAQMQLKAIFSILLRDFEFEMAQPADSYRNDHSKMVVQLQQPCRVRYRRRTVRAASVGAAALAPTGCPVAHTSEA
ncbi:cytochrome P450 [Rhodococcus hoagii]|nr:cytochrome P450 [Prescottella equi]